MLRSLRASIRTHRDARPIRALAAASIKFLRAWHNEAHYDFNSNGEKFALLSYAAWTDKAAPVVWDVGAHQGEWAAEAAVLLPGAEIHSFELIPLMAEALQQQRVSRRHIVHAHGLGRKEEELLVCYNKQHSSTSSVMPRLDSQWFQPTHIEQVKAKIVSGDQLINSGLPSPDFLKIDVEGAEASVLLGLSKTLDGAQGPALIQFEYGDTWIPFGAFLRSVYQQLESAGYRVGRLYPNHVEFKPYSYESEHFRMGNYIAVKDIRLQKILSGVNAR